LQKRRQRLTLLLERQRSRWLSLAWRLLGAELEAAGDLVQQT
jgi:hypothetical protein